MDFEFDLKEVVDCFNIGSNDVTEFGVVVYECKHCDYLFFEDSYVEFN